MSSVRPAGTCPGSMPTRPASQHSHSAHSGMAAHGMPMSWTAATASLPSEVMFQGAMVHSPGGWAALILLSGLLASAASELAAWSLPLEYESLPGPTSLGRMLLAALGCADAPSGVSPVVPPWHQSSRAGPGSGLTRLWFGLPSLCHRHAGKCCAPGRTTAACSSL